jgi:hypothetical protein
LNSRLSRGVTIKCCVAVVGKCEDGLVDARAADDAAADDVDAAAERPDAASSDCMTSASHLRSSSAQAVEQQLFTFSQPLLSRVTWDELGEDEFVVDARLHNISVQTPSRPYTPNPFHSP